MNPVERLLETARSQVGYLEKSKAAYQADPSVLDDFTRGAGSDNYTKYARDQWQEKYFNSKKQGVAWCAVFVGWVFLRTFGKKTALQLQCQPGSGNAGAGCGAAANYYKQKKRWRETPEIGDQIFFTDGTNMTHTGIVEQVVAGRVFTIEGNSEGGVREHRYDIGISRIAGYGHPDWSLVPEEEDKKGDEDMMKSAIVVLPAGARGTTVHMRAQKSTSSTSLIKVPVGSQITVTQDEGEWCRIMYAGLAGWMMSNYIEYADQPDESDDGMTLTAEQLQTIEAALGSLEGIMMDIQEAVDAIGSVVGRG